MKIKLFVLLLLYFLEPVCIKAQDTLTINSISLTTSLAKQSLKRTTAAAAIIDSAQLRLFSSTALLPAFNSVPGVRMEERSPGSYRLSLRGSLLRSPFGVRNVKIYLNEYPLTDAGGNSYINVLPLNSINKVEILKGPDGSLFGANSGGVVSLYSQHKTDQLGGEITTGSYGLFKQDLNATKITGKHIVSIAANYQRSEGYRAHSKLRRFFLQAADQWQYAKNKQLDILVFYSDLYYQTPGGLTQSQYEANAVQARPATATVPGAIQQKAAVYNKMLFSGITHHIAMGKFIENKTAVFASNVDFKNPFITNYEVRKESSFGARSFFSLSNGKVNTSGIIWEYTIGAEWQQTGSSISNFQNNGGTAGSLLAAGTIISKQHFIFNRLKVDLNKKILIEAGVSLNKYAYRFRDSLKLNSQFKPQWMPRFAISYSPIEAITLRGSVSRGYSTPTTAEIRPSDNNIYKNLQAETGFNREVGVRYYARDNRFWADLSAYYYQLKNAIVPQEDAAGNAYFINAGGTKQQGLELQLCYNVVSPANTKRFINKLQVNNSSSLNKFRFSAYVNDKGDFSGKNITGVPAAFFSSSVLLECAPGIYLFAQYNYSDKTPLNDANSVYAKAYSLVQVKIGKHVYTNRSKISFYVGIDNLLNQHYSLGNDLNAAGNRFFNSAAGRNYFAGLIVAKK